ncbi:unnamed protein product [Symbiodinium sp. CCMP2456]|nr:unnamed protein product [Symbiodinium sp. CCMP2456]
MVRWAIQTRNCICAFLPYIFLFNEAITEASGYKVASFGGAVPPKSNESLKPGGAIPLSALQLGTAEIQAGAIIDAVDACLSQRMVAAETDDWKLVRLNKVRRAEIVIRLVRANISLTEFGQQWSDDEAVIEATKMAGRQAAEEIAHKEFEETIDRTLSGSTLTQAAAQDFAAKMEEMAEMCGQGEEGRQLAHDELEVMKSGNMSAMESIMAHELAVYVEELCQVNVLDTDFFVTRLGDISDCNELIGVSLVSKAQKAGRKLDYYAKTAVVLHNKENGVGHQLVHLLHGHGHSEKTHNVESFQSSLRNASRDSAEHVPTMARLRLLDLKYYEHVHGFTVGKYCQGSMGSEAAQWVKDSPEIQNYVDCLCVRQQPSLLCDAQHHQELEAIRPTVMKRLEHAKASAHPAVLMQIAESMKAKGIGLGPCLAGEGFSCTFCVAGQGCVDSGGGFSMDHLAALTALLKGPSSCVDGACGVCMGVKPGDPLTFGLQFGVSVAQCNNAAAFFSSFHIFASLSMCIGGVLGKIASAIGWTACAELANVAYYPFINKMTIALMLPIFIPPPLGVSAGLEVNLNLGDLTPAVYKHCGSQGHKEFNCLQSMFDARGPTGVKVYVKVLIGVKIPVLGEVGKWVEILGFEVAEEDNSRQLAMNKAGVTVEYIGSNSAGGELCGKTFSNVNCIQQAGDPGYRANTADNHNGDRFHVYRNPNDPNDPRALCVRRVDHWNGGWGMKLEIACKVDNNQNGGGGILIPFGSTHHHQKCVMPSQPVHCNWWAGERGHRLGFDQHDAGFSLWHEGGRVCAHLNHRRRRRRRNGGRRRNRRRNNNGWDMNLVVECDATGGEVDYVVQTVDFGKSATNMKCVLPTHSMECEHDAGNAFKRANDHQNGDTFSIWTSHTTHLCVRRTDSGGGWGMDLRVQCKQRQQLWGKAVVSIGSSTTQEKCVLEPQRHLYCDYLAANKEYRNSAKDKPDSFHVEQRDGHVCARRTDHTDRRRHFRRRRRNRRRNEGWGVNLEMECKVDIGPFLAVDIGPSMAPSGYKCVLTTHQVHCDADAGNVNKRLNEERNGDTFVVWQSHTQHICARRTDVMPGGWGMHLRLQCDKQAKHEWRPVRVVLGSSMKNEKCFREPNNKVFCDTLVGDPEHRLNNNIHMNFIFDIQHRGNNICVRRTDNVHHGWGFQLEVMCKQFPYAIRAAPAQPVGLQPAGMSAMVAWYKSEDANPFWRSSVGNWEGRVTKGSVTRKYEAGHGATGAVAYILGNSGDGFNFFQVLTPDFTICSVTRYAGPTQKRILQNNKPNFLHGHWFGKVGTAFYSTWVSQGEVVAAEQRQDWLVMCGNSNGVVYIGREKKNVGQHAAVKTSGNVDLYVNEGLQEFSDFGVMEVITWNRPLNDDEMWTSMEYLNWKLEARPADVSSMVAWFKSEDANPVWRSAVGNVYGEVIKGGVARKVEAGNGAKEPVAFLKGDTAAGFDFGRIMKKDFTICSVTRYTGGAMQRILQHHSHNFLHGHWAERVGVAYYGGWVVEAGVSSKTDWLVMCGNSEGVVYRGKENRNIGHNGEVKTNPDVHLYINKGFDAEVSDFAVMEVIVWNRALSGDEMWSTMLYLNSKLEHGSQ